MFRGRPGKPNQRKGQNEKFMNFAHFCVNSGVFLRKTSTIHIELLFRNALRKVHELTFLWFGLPGPLLICSHLKKGELVKTSAFTGEACKHLLSFDLNGSHNAILAESQHVETRNSPYKDCQHWPFLALPLIGARFALGPVQSGGLRNG